jgi:hypothetical protein
LVRDAETQEPISGGGVRISYPLTAPAWAPQDSVGTTGADGIARLRAAPSGDAGPLVEVTAPGYLGADKNLPVAVVQAIEPAHLFEAVERRPVNLVVELYAEPRPTVEFIVPAGYHGLVKAEVCVEEDVPGPPGQRCFPYLVPPSGVVQVTGPRLLRRLFPLDFHARYADGTALGRPSGGSELGFWWLRTEGHTEVFLVGTRREFDNLRPADQPGETRAGRSSGGGRSGGRGRRNRQAEPPPSDSGPAGMMP